VYFSVIYDILLPCDVTNDDDDDGPHYKMCRQNHFWFVNTHRETRKNIKCVSKMHIRNACGAAN